MLNKKLKKYWGWLSVLTVIVLIVFLALVDLESDFLLVIGKKDKLLHFLTFFFLVFIAKAFFRKIKIGIIAIYVLSFGFILEIAQEFLTHNLRHFHIIDILANILGTTLATIIVVIVSKLRNHFIVIGRSIF